MPILDRNATTHSHTSTDKVCPNNTQIHNTTSSIIEMSLFDCHFRYRSHSWKNTKTCIIIYTRNTIQIKSKFPNPLCVCVCPFSVARQHEQPQRGLVVVRSGGRQQSVRRVRRQCADHRGAARPHGLVFHVRRLVDGRPRVAGLQRMRRLQQPTAVPAVRRPVRPTVEARLQHGEHSASSKRMCPNLHSIFSHLVPSAANSRMPAVKHAGWVTVRAIRPSPIRRCSPFSRPPLPPPLCCSNICPPRQPRRSRQPPRRRIHPRRLPSACHPTTPAVRRASSRRNSSNSNSKRAALANCCWRTICVCVWNDCRPRRRYERGGGIEQRVVRRRPSRTEFNLVNAQNS